MVDNTKQRPERNESEMTGEAEEDAKKDILPPPSASKSLEGSDEEPE